MTIEEAQVCAELFAEAKRGIVPEDVVAMVRAELKQACTCFPSLIGMIEPGDMDRLFVFFRALLARFVGREISELLGFDAANVFGDFERQFGDPDQQPSLEEEAKFRDLIRKVDVSVEPE